MSDPTETGATVHKIRAVATEVCEAEFLRFVDLMDLDIDPKGMDEEDRLSFENSKRVVIRAMETENLVVNDKGEFIYRPKSDDDSEITFHEPVGGTLMAQDAKREGHDVAKTFAVLAAMTGQPAKRFSGMPQRDLKVCSAILVLFLG